MTEGKPQQKEPEKEIGLPLGSIALDMVRKGDAGGEKYKIHPRGPAVLKQAIKATLLSGEAPPKMAKRFKQVIALCYVLAEREACPNAAQVLSDVLLENPEVQALIKPQDTAARQSKKKYQKFLDDQDVARAPKIDDAVPDDSVKLASFLDPVQNMANQARQRAARTQRNALTPTVTKKGKPIAPKDEQAGENKPKMPSKYGRKV